MNVATCLWLNLHNLQPNCLPKALHQFISFMVWAWVSVLSWVILVPITEISLRTPVFLVHLQMQLLFQQNQMDYNIFYVIQQYRIFS